MPVIGTLAFVGGGVMGWKVCRAAIAALPTEQKQKLKDAADAVSMQVPGINDEPTPEFG